MLLITTRNGLEDIIYIYIKLVKTHYFSKVKKLVMHFHLEQKLEDYHVSYTPFSNGNRSSLIIPMWHGKKGMKNLLYGSKMDLARSRYMC